MKMRFLRASIVVLLAGASSSAFASLSDDYSFEKYVQDFAKQYGSEEEYLRRQKIWEENRNRILEHNNEENPSGCTLEMNMFADLLDDEVPTGYDKSFHSAWSSTSALGEKKAAERPHPTLDVSALVTALPDAVDWRAKGVTTTVKNQGHCGSCWAFAATAALESHIAIKTEALFSLSMQELVSCVPNPKECGGEGACTGSTPEIAYDFVAKHGVVEEWRFGYQSFNGQVANCTILPDHSPLLRGSDDETIEGAVASIVGFSNLPSNHYASMMIAVATMGPVVVAVAASGWGLYKGGVYDDSKSTTRPLNHAVVLEGYGTDQETGEDYWLIRNSWGPRWGENGYIRLKRVDPSTLDDPDSDCKIDDKPGDGVACKKDDDGNDIVPQAVSVCGTSGILFDGVVPIGGHLL